MRFWVRTDCRAFDFYPNLYKRQAVIVQQSGKPLFYGAADNNDCRVR